VAVEHTFKCSSWARHVRGLFQVRLELGIGIEMAGVIGKRRNKRMAAGKAIGEFLFKAVTRPRADELGMSFNGIRSSLSHCNLRRRPKGGTYSSRGAAYLDNGDSPTSIGHGTYESAGKHRWRTENFLQISDGRRIRGEGEIDLASRTWRGTMLEMS
jgi:hypothetical protein